MIKVEQFFIEYFSYTIIGGSRVPLGMLPLSNLCAISSIFMGFATKMLPNNKQVGIQPLSFVALVWEILYPTLSIYMTICLYLFYGDGFFLQFYPLPRSSHFFVFRINILILDNVCFPQVWITATLSRCTSRIKESHNWIYIKNLSWATVRLYLGTKVTLK